MAFRSKPSVGVSFPKDPDRWTVREGIAFRDAWREVDKKTFRDAFGNVSRPAFIEVRISAQFLKNNETEAFNKVIDRLEGRKRKS